MHTKKFQLTGLWKKWEQGSWWMLLESSRKLSKQMGQSRLGLSVTLFTTSDSSPLISSAEAVISISVRMVHNSLCNLSGSKLLTSSPDLRRHSQCKAWRRSFLDDRKIYKKCSHPFYYWLTARHGESAGWSWTTPAPVRQILGKPWSVDHCKIIINQYNSQYYQEIFQSNTCYIKIQGVIHTVKTFDKWLPSPREIYWHRCYLNQELFPFLLTPKVRAQRIGQMAVGLVFRC